MKKCIIVVLDMLKRWLVDIVCPLDGAIVIFLLTFTAYTVRYINGYYKTLHDATQNTAKSFR